MANTDRIRQVPGTADQDTLVIAIPRSKISYIHDTLLYGMEKWPGPEETDRVCQELLDIFLYYGF